LIGIEKYVNQKVEKTWHASQNYVITSLHHDIKVDTNLYPTRFYINCDNFVIFGMTDNEKMHTANWCLFTYLQECTVYGTSWLYGINMIERMSSTFLRDVACICGVPTYFICVFLHYYLFHVIVNKFHMVFVAY
jgi:hypothetical protein